MEPLITVQYVVDREARNRAADLLEAYASGALALWEVQERWAESARDCAVERIGKELLDRLPPERLTEEVVPTTQRTILRLIAQCAAFLRTDLAYNHGPLSIGGCMPWLFLVVMLAFGAFCVAAVAICVTETVLPDTGVPGVIFIVVSIGALGIGVSIRRRIRDIQVLLRDDIGPWPFESEHDLAEAGGGRDTEAPNVYPPDE